MPSKTRYFNPRSPHGERPLIARRVNAARLFQPTLPARGATSICLKGRKDAKISTHAPRTGSDIANHVLGQALAISTHAPRTGSDDKFLRQGRVHTGFQPTLPARGATVEFARKFFQLIDFNPRSPHGERPHQYAFAGDLQNFNPRSPHGERPHWDRPKTSAKDISTHAPRTGSDALGSPENKRKRHFNPRSPHGERRRFDCTGRNYGRYFNPRSPHGERLNPPDEGRWHGPFQPTLPARGATRKIKPPGCVSAISTHAPRTGSDAPPT